MAKQAKKKAKTPERRRKGGSTRLLIFLTLVVLIPFSLPTVLVLVVGMLPTIAAATVERSRNRYGWVCVGGLNFAGLAPWLFSLWFGHHTLEFAFEQVTSISMLLVSYGAAALGTLLYLSVPPVVATVMAATGQHRALGLTGSQRKLVDDWGDDVGLTAPGANQQSASGGPRR